MTTENIAILIIIATVILYCINKFPPFFVSLISILAMVFFHVLDFKTAFGGFATNSLMMIAGMMLLGQALVENGVADLIAGFVFKRFSDAPMRLVVAIFFSAALLSAFLQNMAVLVVFFALIDAYMQNRDIKLRRKSLYMLAMIGCLIGGNSTLAGSSPPGVANSILETMEGSSLGFFEPGIVGIPLLIVMAFLYRFVFYKLSERIFYQAETDEMDLSDNRCVDPISGEKIFVARKMWTSLIIAIVAIACLVFFPKIPSSVIALSAVCSLVLLDCLDPLHALQNLNWPVLILLACTSGIAAGFKVTGLGDSVVHEVAARLGTDSGNMAIWVVVFVFLSGITTNFISNASAIAIFSTLASSVSEAQGVSATPLVMSCLWGGCTGMSLPISCATVSMTMQAGLSVRDYLKFGTLISLTMWVIASITIILWYGL